MSHKDRMVEAVVDVLAPVHQELGERLPVFEWGHEVTPTLADVRELASDIVDALLRVESAPPEPTRRPRSGTRMTIDVRRRHTIVVDVRERLEQAWERRHDIAAEHAPGGYEPTYFLAEENKPGGAVKQWPANPR